MRNNLVSVALKAVLITLIGVLIGVVIARSYARDAEEAEKAPLEGAIYPPVVDTPIPWESPQIKKTSVHVGPLPYVPDAIPEPTKTAEEMSLTTEQIEPDPEPEPEPEPILSYLGRYDIVGYDTCEACCGKTDGITKSGAVATVGRTAAAKDLPFGTRIYIDGIGERVVEDRGYLAGGVIDVLCSNHAECYAITGSYDVYIVEDGE